MQGRSTMRDDSKRKRKSRAVVLARKLPTAPAPMTQAPKHLSREARAWWESIIEAYMIEQHHLRVLLVAAEALDRREEARAALKKYGMVYEDDRGMIRPRPEVGIEKECTTSFLRALRALKLEGEA